MDKIAALNFNTDYAQVAGKITDIEIVGEKRGRRLIAHLQDETGEIELVWFQGATWLDKVLQVGQEYIIYGRVTIFSGKKTMAHPEMELLSEVSMGSSVVATPVIANNTLFLPNRNRIFAIQEGAQSKPGK